MSKKKVFKTHPMFSTEYMDIIINLHCFFDDYDKMQAWLITENKDFGGVSPADIIVNGKAKYLIEKLDECLYKGKQV